MFWTGVQCAIRALQRPKPTVLNKVDDLKPGDRVRVEMAPFDGAPILHTVLYNEHGWVATADEFNYSHGFANRAIQRGEVIVTLLP